MVVVVWRTAVPAAFTSCTDTPGIPDSPVSSRPLLLTSFQTVLPSVSVKLGATTPKSRDRFELLLVSPSLVGSPPAVRVMSPLSMKPPLPRVPLGAPSSLLLTLSSGSDAVAVLLTNPNRAPPVLKFVAARRTR